MPKIAFNTATMVGRVTDYRFSLREWGEQHKKTALATDEAAWYAICQEIADAGFTAIEIWEAHAAPETMNEARASMWLQIMEDHGLRAVGYAGSFRPETIRVCQWLDIGTINGGTKLEPTAANELARRAGVQFNLENHPQKSAAEILKAIGGGSDWMGVCIDTGWLGSQGVNAPMVIRDCGHFVRHVHIKDVEESGGHATCQLGTGCAEVEECLQALHDYDYDGWLAWEDEPEDRNPMLSAAQNRQWLERHVR